MTIRRRFRQRSQPLWLEGGGTYIPVYLPGGIYHISSTLTITAGTIFSIIGDGPTFSEIAWYGGSSGIAIEVGNGSANPQYGIYRGFSIYGHNDVVGLQFQQAFNCVVQNCEFSACKTAVDMESSSGSNWIQNCVFDTQVSGYYGILFNSTASGNVVANCTVSTSAIGIGFTSSNASCLVEGCVFEPNTTAIYAPLISGSTVSITLNSDYFETNTTVINAGGSGSGNAPQITLTGCSFTSINPVVFTDVVGLNLIGNSFAYPVASGTALTIGSACTGVRLISNVYLNTAVKSNAAADTVDMDGKLTTVQQVQLLAGAAIGAAGTNDQLVVAGAAAGTGPSLNSLNNAGNAYAHLTVNASDVTVAPSGTPGFKVFGDGFGYPTGSGGAVAQITSRTTGVTLNTASGAITLVSAAGSATPASFTVTDSAVAATDGVMVQEVSGTDLYEIFVTAIGAGSFKVTYFTTGGTTTEQPVFKFTVLKGANS